DGMADYPVDSLDGKTPLSVANNPNMDELCKKGELGLVKTVAEHLSPGSDVANLSVMGYDPDIYYTGRSPLEALSIGVNLRDSDVTFRANVVTLSDEENYADKTMVDYSSGEITTHEAHELINYLKENMSFDHIDLYGGTSYRHLVVWDGGSTNVTLTPPHDISDKKVTEYLPKGEGADILLEMMKKSHELLKNHPVNLDRIKRGLNPANSLWIWGEGTKPMLSTFAEKFGTSGTMISAVDLLKGIGNGTKMDVLEVEGATGNIDTNFDGKAAAAIKAFENGTDFVYIHMEAPDECGHHGDAQGKIRSIELIDEKVIKPVVDFLKSCGEDFRVLITPDHPTPIALKTHVRDAIPFVIYDSRKDTGLNLDYTEDNAKETGLYIEPGYKLMERFLEK
ncbi:MAG: cofactor-independent phosphoglycerate mutase, partial [Clostridia bacterium]|nr:cofactor-independent phosphoglycerate mutase [Clostridia bacterium]